MNLKMIKLSYSRPINKIIFLIFISLLYFNSEVNAQSYKINSEIGVSLGTSYYLGDLNKSHYNNLQAGVGLSFRKNIDRRVSYKAELIFCNLKGDDRTNTNDSIALDRGLHFRSQIYELSGQLEFNFLPYETGNSLYPWSPFIFTGISLFHFNPQAENKNGEWVTLNDLGTEGQGTSAFPNRKKYSLIQFSIPIGGGVKISVSETFNIILQYGIRKTFTDYIDDVSTTYVGNAINGTYPIEMSNSAIEMADPSETHYQGDQRGNSENNDWYSFTGITLSFKLKSQTPGCNY